MSGPGFLSGYRILDLSQYIPGPYAAREMATLGADVLKIEPPHGDPMRVFMCAGDDPVSPVYRHLNRGKRVARLDLKSASGAERMRDLLVEADVLLESFRPGVLARLGFGRDALQAINDRLVYCALSGFGQTGPFRARAGHDLTYCAVSGAMSLSGTAEQPVMTFPPLADHAGAIQAVNAILAALLGRQRTGKGCYLDISLSEAAMAWQYLGFHANAPAREQLLLNGGAACYNIYRTADGRFVALGALEEKFWQDFCDGIGRPEWILRQHEALPQTELINELRDLFATESRAYWVEKLQSVDCCFEPVAAIDEVATHPQTRARELLKDGEPIYPAWIDGSPMTLAPEVEELPSDQPPRWR